MLKIIQISLFTLVVIGLLVMMGFIVKENHTSIIDSIELDYYRNSEKGFLSNEVVLNTIDNIDSVSSLSVNDINSKTIENKLLTNPYIDEVDSYLTLDGKLLINIKEKSPIIRIFDKNGNSFYIDNQGDFIPISKNYTPRVLIANGYINEININFTGNINDTTYNKTIIKDIYILTKLIYNNEFLSSQINQIYYNSKDDYDLIPKLGDHVIRFGKIENAQSKLINLEAYYKKNMISPNWDNYSTINLIYKDQIVCTKK